MLRSPSLPDEPDEPMSPPGGFAARSFRVPACPSRLARVRRDVDDAAAAFGLGPVDCYQLVVAVNEAATNAIKHGRPFDDGTIGLRIDACGDTLVCSVHDSGRFVSDPVAPDPLAECGRGLAVMEQFADATEISTGARGTTVCLYKRRCSTTEREGEQALE